MTTSPSPGLYVHIPFCSAICPYCDFAVTTGGSERRGRFIEALLAEIGRDRGSALDGWDPFDTVYLGGGTPSALPVDELGRLTAEIGRRLPLTDRPVISMEANPEDVTSQTVAGWAQLGVDRLSLGIQSFDAVELAFLGRRHDPAQAVRAVELSLASGLTVSLDLIYGLPEQSPPAWQRNLERAVELEPHHISCYQLTVEPGTAFARRSRRGEWNAPGEDDLAELFFRTHEFLATAGYPAYEVSNFARGPRSQCGHNRKYWEGARYLGLGPSAHSFDGRSRWWNHSAEPVWRSVVEAGGNPEADRETLSLEARALEFVMLGLRTPCGLDLGKLDGFEPEDVLRRNQRVLARAADEGLLSVEGERLVPTLGGMARADAIARSIELRRSRGFGGC